MLLYLRQYCGFFEGGAAIPVLGRSVSLGGGQGTGEQGNALRVLNVCVCMCRAGGVLWRLRQRLRVSDSGNLRSVGKGIVTCAIANL